MKETLSSKVPTTRIVGVTFDSVSESKSKLKSGSTTATTATTATATGPPSPPSSYVIKCLLKTARFMWQVTTIPAKIGDTLGTLYRYAQDSVDTFLCVAGKARRKERDGDQNSTDTKLYLEESVLERKLPEADLKALVDLPAGLDYNEWLASHTLALFEHVNLVYGTISEFCTQSGCADMTGPGNRTYLWFDEKGKKTRVAAPQYIDYVMTFTQKTVSDESIFPTKYANEFPGSFESIARKILRLQFHVIAHLYAAHFREIALLGLHTHLNLTFAHLTALHRRFNLIDEKETDVLRDLEVALRLTDDSGQDSSSSVHEHSSSSSSPPVVAAVASGCEQQQQQQHQQQQHNNSSSTSNSNSSAEALHVNSQSNTNSHTTSASASASASASLIDGDSAAPPICTQPEAGAGCKPAGSSGLLGGILGDLTSGEFGDTTRYCTSAVPQAAASSSAAGPAADGTSSAALNNGAGALHLNFSNNNNNNHNLNHHHHQHHHHQHHHHGHHGHGHHQAPASTTVPHSGLIQCNAAGAGGGNAASAAPGGATSASSTA
ncbi:MOB kinase activator-like 2 isoform X2 [Drosophila obscura]|uniref:MOB kinase activator-like 2 isoform X2 n=1 Tax=Drosophila obscura TaxID=7282 RepID=UPI001BB183C3|nr:MOB kinase activator-like 2 isoform X2 [Drosophila obscura]XP_022232172.2 MOB kinase activator-like 2 isoform X2 [Drosophila obscura]